MYKSTEKGVVQTGNIWHLTEEDRAEIANIFNEGMELLTPCRTNHGLWLEREKSPIRDRDNYRVFTRGQLEGASYE